MAQKNEIPPTAEKFLDSLKRIQISGLLYMFSSKIYCS